MSDSNGSNDFGNGPYPTFYGVPADDTFGDDWEDFAEDAEDAELAEIADYDERLDDERNAAYAEAADFNDWLLRMEAIDDCNEHDNHNEWEG